MDSSNLIKSISFQFPPLFNSLLSINLPSRAVIWDNKYKLIVVTISILALFQLPHILNVSIPRRKRIKPAPRKDESIQMLSIDGTDATLLKTASTAIHLPKAPPKLSLTPFTEQLNHIIAQIHATIAQYPYRILLVEGPPGIGKGSALQTLVYQSPPGIYLKLSTSITKHLNHSNPLSSCIGESFGLSQCELSELYIHTTKLLQESLLVHGKPFTLAIDDFQMLFDAEGPLEAYAEDLPLVYEFLADAQSKSLVSVILSTSCKSVLRVTKQFMGFDSLVYKSLENVAESVIVEYFVECINPLLEGDSKFTPRSAAVFVEMLGLNFTALSEYAESGMSLFGTSI
jgi:hypothetical protein